MQRIKDDFLDSIEEVVSLAGKEILEIGCGNGSRSVQIAKRCTHLTAIDPSPESINLAKSANSSSNIDYHLGSAEHLVFSNRCFDAVLFTLSLHHVPTKDMQKAIGEAVRVTKVGGYIIYLEPTEDGTFFEAEITFDACDGDEREEKRAAYNALKHHSGYEEIAEKMDETVFQFDSVEDFVDSLSPKKNLEEIEDFLEKNDYILKAKRRINVFKVL